MYTFKTTPYKNSEAGPPILYHKTFLLARLCMNCLDTHVHFWNIVKSVQKRKHKFSHWLFNFGLDNVYEIVWLGRYTFETAAGPCVDPVKKKLNLYHPCTSKTFPPDIFFRILFLSLLFLNWLIQEQCIRSAHFYQKRNRQSRSRIHFPEAGLSILLFINCFAQETYIRNNPWYLCVLV